MKLDKEKIAHELALLFAKHELDGIDENDIMNNNTQKIYVLAEAYKEAYDQLLEDL